jgi:hypothetical protein
MTRPSAVYFDWLTQQFEILGKSKRTYQALFLKLFSTEFVWTIPGDDNRVKDALDLRREFENQGGPRFGRIQTLQFVTVLEVLLALSRRLAFLAGGEAPEWAWHLLENLNIEGCSDPLTLTQSGHIDEVLDALVWRTYQKNGRGGFFPLKKPKGDQRKVELWYQMQEYISEIQEP